MYIERKDLMDFLGTLPKLEGTEKQVKWAEEIRADHFSAVLYEEDGELKNLCIEGFLEDAGTRMEERFEKKYGLNYTQAAETERKIASITSAKWWIENKEIAKGGHSTWTVLGKEFHR
jgi:hypothetical protein